MQALSFPFLRILRWALLAIIVTSSAHAQEQVLRVGVTSGPHEEIFEAVKKVAARDYGLHIRIVNTAD